MSCDIARDIACVHNLNQSVCNLFTAQLTTHYICHLVAVTYTI